MKPQALDELRHTLEALNGVIHRSLGQTPGPSEAPVPSLVQRILQLATLLPELEPHCAILAEEAPHFPDAHVRSRIRMLNAIQSMLWTLESLSPASPSPTPA